MFLFCSYRGTPHRSRVRPRTWKTLRAGFLSLFLPCLAAPATAADVPDPSVGRLNHAGYKDRQHCTATLVGAATAVTAKHCLVQGDVTEMHFLLGYDRGRWAEHRQPVAAATDGLPGDVAFLCLGARSAATPMRIANRAAQRGETVVVIGYGRPRVHVASRTLCRVTATDGSKAFQLDCPLAPGSSGGPVLRTTSDGPEILGVVSATSRTRSVAYGIAGTDGTAPCNGPRKGR
ncbi:MAG: serine protease [Pseudomonadota bacterium]